MKLLILIATAACFMAGAASAEKLSVSGCVIPDRVSFPTHQMTAGMPSNRLLNWAYNTIRAQNVLTAGECTCDMLHPAWTLAQAEYEKLFGNLGAREATPDWVRAYGKESNTSLTKAVKLCGKQGVY